MKYDGTAKVERIFVRTADNENKIYYIDIYTCATEPYFGVYCNCDDEWCNEFEYDITFYEEIKHLIMCAIEECKDMQEFMKHIDDFLAEKYEEILN